MIEFIIPGEPPTVTAQQKGQNRRTGKYYKPPELRDAEQKYMAYAYQARPAEPFTGSVQLIVIFGFVVTGKHKPGEPKITKPDTDNMVKLLKDCLTKCGFWKDDAQVAHETVVKVWTNSPGIVVMAAPWENEEGGIGNDVSEMQT